jgi:hypothetical protein
MQCAVLAHDRWLRAHQPRPDTKTVARPKIYNFSGTLPLPPGPLHPDTVPARLSGKYPAPGADRERNVRVLAA